MRAGSGEPARGSVCTDTRALSRGQWILALKARRKIQSPWTLPYALFYPFSPVFKVTLNSESTAVLYRTRASQPVPSQLGKRSGRRCILRSALVVIGRRVRARLHNTSQRESLKCAPLGACICCLIFTGIEKDEVFEPPNTVVVVVPTISLITLLSNRFIARPASSASTVPFAMAFQPMSEEPRRRTPENQAVALPRQ